MIRLLAIPVAGTVAALIAILVFHKEREVDAATTPDSGPSPAEIRPELPDMPDLPAPETDTPVTPPAPETIDYQLQLERDGSFVEVGPERPQRYKNVDELKKGAAEARVKLRIVLQNGEGVDEAALDAALAKLAKSFAVRRFYTPPPPKDG